MTKRLFIAIEVPEEIKKELLKIQQQFYSSGAKLVKPEHMHLTMIFLGEVEKVWIKEISEICQKVAINFQPFYIHLTGLGAFPKSHCPHTIWVGIEKSNQLILLQKEISWELIHKKFKIEERPFAPHLTIARLKKPINIQEYLEKNISIDLGSFQAKELVLFQSELFPEGPRHTAIKVFPI